MVKKKGNRLVNFITNPKYLMVLATICIFLVIYTAGAIMYGSKGFTTLRTFMMLFVDNAYIGISAVGMTMVLITGGIDLSVAAVASLTGMFIAYGTTVLNIHPVVCMLFAICVAVSLGLAMGAMVTYLKIPPFVATLTGMFLARGVCSLISRDSISINNELIDTLAGWNVYAIGGVLLSGGVGYMVGTFFGVLLKAVIPSLITFNGTLSSWWGKIITGLLVLLFVALQQVAITGKLGKKKVKTPTPKIE